MGRLVALRLADPAATVAALDAVWAAGDAALPLDPHAPRAHTEELLGRLRPHELRGDEGTRRLPDGVPVPDGTGLVVTTSGSTGRPTGVVLSHEALATATRLSRTRLGAADGVPWIGVLPLHHVAGISVVLRSRAAGREPLLHGRATPGALDAAEPSWVSLVPAQLRRLLASGADLARHHGVLLGGAAVPPGLLEAAGRQGLHVVTSYGATETCGGCVYDGRPLDGVEVRVGGNGRLQLRTPTIASGTRDPDGTTTPLVDDEGWWTSPDLGRVQDGRVVVLGRADDVVVSGGENVALAPVRSALAGLDGIAASAVVGIADERWGTAVAAVVVPSGPAPTLQQVRDELAPVLPRAQVPTALVVADELPTGTLGKVTSTAVEAALQAGTARIER